MLEGTLLDENFDIIEYPSKETIDVALTPDELYTVLECLYFDTTAPASKVLDLIKQLEYRLLDYDLPADRAEYYAQGMVNHPDNEQYKRITYWRDAEHNDN
jgi:hypothetical protein